MFRSVILCNDDLTALTEAESLHISEIKTEAITGKITVSVECDCASAGVHIPDAAVVIEIEHQIQTSATRKAEDGDDIVIALAADHSFPFGHLQRPGFCHNGARRSAGVEHFGACGSCPSV